MATNLEVDNDGFPRATYLDLKRLAKEFHDALPTATPEEADAGFKCFSIAWMNRADMPGYEEVGAVMILKIVSREMIEYQVRHPEDFGDPLRREGLAV